ncbi:MAG: hypothetical protein GX654_13755 [Desulfatiglans sp.]|nr:hypothetical protein [Desulfatiglans sp.]
MKIKVQLKRLSLDGRGWVRVEKIGRTICSVYSSGFTPPPAPPTKWRGGLRIP